MRNDSNQAVTYSFSSGKQFDIWVICDGGECFRLSRRLFYTQATTSLTLRPGDSKTYCGEWDQKDNTGTQVGPGTYSAYAQLTPSGKPPPATSARVQVGARGAKLIPMTIKEAISNIKALEGKRVMVSAVYKGSRPNPYDSNTKDGPPVTRSDWAICDKTGCMYVTGSVALDPANDKDVPITVTGKLHKTPKGQVYMILESAAVDKKVTCPPAP